jgi:hypothetical protein
MQRQSVAWHLRIIRSVRPPLTCTARKFGSAYAAWVYSPMSPLRIVRRRTRVRARSVIGGVVTQVVEDRLVEVGFEAGDQLVAGGAGRPDQA